MERTVFQIVVAPDHPVVARIYGEGREDVGVRAGAFVGQRQAHGVGERFAHVHDFHPIRKSASSATNELLSAINSFNLNGTSVAWLIQAEEGTQGSVGCAPSM